MRNLYQRMKKEPELLWELNEVEKDIINNWTPEYNLFSMSQMCDRHGISKRACRRKLKRFFKNEIIKKYRGIK